MDVLSRLEGGESKVTELGKLGQRNPICDEQRSEMTLLYRTWRGRTDRPTEQTGDGVESPQWEVLPVPGSVVVGRERGCLMSLHRENPESPVGYRIDSLLSLEYQTVPHLTEGVRPLGPSIRP